MSKFEITKIERKKTNSKIFATCLDDRDNNICEINIKNNSSILSIKKELIKCLRSTYFERYCDSNCLVEGMVI